MRWIALFACGASLWAQTLEGTKPFERTGDIAPQMVEGIFQHLHRLNAEAVSKRRPTRELLRKITGVVDDRIPFSALELVATTAQPALIASMDEFAREHPDASLSDFLENVTLQTSADEHAGGDRVTLMVTPQTIAASQGSATGLASGRCGGSPAD